jgi:Sulfatase-modifying factor enzyme 1
MRTVAMRGIMVSALLVLPAGAVIAQGAKPLEKCPDDAVVSGTVCMDKYEASVWRVPVPTTINKNLVMRIRQGKATAADLQKGGATQLGVVGPDYAPCDEGGQFCADDIFAVSVPGVLPSANITWFQAQAACKNARKRLASNAEWQAAAAGTNRGPDDHVSTCNTDGGVGFNTVQTGSRASCVSTDLAFDMVGNVSEWVADWVPRSNSCPGWGSFSDDFMCLAPGASVGPGPGALFRGGDWTNGTGAGVFAVVAIFDPLHATSYIGFRCAR